MAGIGRDGFVGRDASIVALERRLAAALEGLGGVVIVEGDAGIGKTALVRHVLAGIDARVSWSRCLEGGDAAFSPWAMVLDGFEPGGSAPIGAGTLSATEVGAVAMVSRATAARWWPGGSVGDEDRPFLARGEMVAAAGRAISRLAAGVPRVLVIDDAHWADVPSLLLLGELRPSLEQMPCAVVLTARPSEVGGPEADYLADLRRQATVIALGGLGADDVAALLASGGLPTDGELAGAVAERTGGNPFFVTELVRSMQVAYPDSHASELKRTVLREVPREVTGLVRRRLARMPTPVAELLEVAAILGVEGNMALLADVAGVQPADALDLLAPAAAAGGLVEYDSRRWRLVHDLLRDAIVDGLAARRRCELHRAALAAVQRGSAPAAVQARHALSALPLVDEAVVVDLVRRAAQDAVDGLAFEAAAAWCDAALSAVVASSDQTRADLLLAAGSAYRKAGNPAAARPAFRAAYDMVAGDPDRLALAALGYGDPGADLGLAYEVHDLSTASLLAGALEAQPTGDRATTVRLQARLAAELYFGADAQASRPLVEDAVSAARRLGDSAALVAALAVRHDGFVVGGSDPSVALAGSTELSDLARSSGDRTAKLTAHRARVIDLLVAGNIAAVDAEIIAFERLAGPSGEPGLRWWPLLWRAMRALLDGRLDLGSRLADEALEVGNCAFGHGAFGGLAFANHSFHLFFSFREQGRLAELEEIARAYVSSQAHVPGIKCSLALLLAEVDRLDEAGTVLSATVAGGLDRLGDRNWPVWWFLLARTASLVGDVDIARSLLAAPGPFPGSFIQVSAGTVCLGAADLGYGWLYATVGDPASAEAAFRRAISSNALIGARSWLAQARFDLGALLVLDTRIDEARPLLDLALEASRSIGLADLERRVDACIARLAEEPAASFVSTQPGAKNTFRRTGTSWELTYGNRSVHVTHSKGLNDLAVLLARPGEPVAAVELMAIQADGFIPGGSDIDVFDRRALGEVRRRLAELQADLDEADIHHDPVRSERLASERDALIESLAAARGLGGRPRRLDDPAERARKAVTARIRNSLDRLAGAHPDLARHLERSIDTGAWCCYNPAVPITWEM